MKLVHKMALAFSIITIVFVVFIALMTVTLKINQQSIKQIEQYNLQLEQAGNAQRALLAMENGQRGFVITGYEDFMAPYESSLKQFNQSLSTLRESELSEQGKVLLQDIRDIFDGWHEVALIPTLNMAKRGDLAEARRYIGQARGEMLLEDLRVLFDEYRTFKREAVRLQQQRARFFDQLSVWVMFGGTLLLLVVVAVAAISVRRQLLKRLQQTVNAAKEIGQGNLLVEIETSKKDEVNEVMMALDAMRLQLQTILGAVNQAGDEIHQVGDDLVTTSGSLSQTVKQENEASNEVLRAIQLLNEHIAHVAAQSSQAGEVALSSGEDMHKSAATVENAVNSMEAIAASVKESSGDIHSLGEQSKQITEIVDTIKIIADQTNLLALNAAIEAARAGEHGRGFAVVADEVRALATRTSTSTGEIEGMVQKIQDVAQRSVQQMNEGVERVNKGVKEGEEAKQAIRTIQSNFDQVVALIQDISVALDEQKQTSEGLSNSTDQFQNSVNETAQASQSTSAAAEQLDRLSAQLQHSLKRFKLQ